MYMSRQEEWIDISRSVSSLLSKVHSGNLSICATQLSTCASRAEDLGLTDALLQQVLDVLRRQTTDAPLFAELLSLLALQPSPTSSSSPSQTNNSPTTASSSTSSLLLLEKLHTLCGVALQQLQSQEADEQSGSAEREGIDGQDEEGMQRARVRGLVVMFAELFKRSVLTGSAMLDCFEWLLRECEEPRRHWEYVEVMCRLLVDVGPVLDNIAPEDEDISLRYEHCCERLKLAGQNDNMPRAYKLRFSWWCNEMIDGNVENTKQKGFISYLTSHIKA